MTTEEVIKQMLQVKEMADGRVSLVSCQGQAMDGYSELANYRALLEEYESNKSAEG